MNLTQNFVNFTSESHDDHIIFKFEESNFEHTNTTTWENLQCNKDEELDNKITIKTNCTFGGKTDNDLSYYKIFVEGYKDLYEYIQKIKDESISKENHKKLFDYILERLNQVRDKFKGQNINLNNDNREVPILHFRFV
jgi:hypothetical protein